MLRYAITDRSLLRGPETERIEALIAQCARLAREGIDFLQLREKDLPPPELTEVSRQVLQAVRAGNGKTKLLLNSRVDTSLHIGADGVHLSRQPEAIRRIRRDFLATGLAQPILSLSCHTLDDVRAAIPFRPDFLLFAPVFGKSVRGQLVCAPAGLAALAEICREAGPIPVLALGGVTAENAAACVRAGAAGVAGIRLFLHEPPVDLSPRKPYP